MIVFKTITIYTILNIATPSNLPRHNFYKTSVFNVSLSKFSDRSVCADSYSQENHSNYMQKINSTELKERTPSIKFHTLQPRTSSSRVLLRDPGIRTILSRSWYSTGPGAALHVLVSDFFSIWATRWKPFQINIHLYNSMVEMFLKREKWLNKETFTPCRVGF